jgi:hypothetical protein
VESVEPKYLRKTRCGLISPGKSICCVGGNQPSMSGFTLRGCSGLFLAMGGHKG